MKKILEKSGKNQGILSEEKSGNPVVNIQLVVTLLLLYYPPT